uniref:Protein ENHANCED DISEASE RESISTANCE 2 C-terminal domain-containing protein n=1 Tax=Ditylum brightwellii TaxID=49249 RepID=A0A7S4UUX1_9STRA
MKSQRVSHNSSLDALKDLVYADDKSILTVSLSSSTLSDAVGDGAEGDDAISNEPPSCEFCCTFDANSHRVRGKNYNRDKKKVEAGPSLFRYFAADVVEVDEYVREGFCNLPNERVQLALKREQEMHSKGLPSDMPPYIVAVNIIMPGPPKYHLVFYYAVDDMSIIDGTDETPSSKLANQFFFGDSDAFREKTFKLIPRIAKGNRLVKKAVGTTPVIIGKKIATTFVRSDRFCEIICDVTSSTVAKKVCSLVNSYAKSLVVEMGYLLEGDDSTVLPERIFGCIRLNHIDITQLRRIEMKEEGNNSTMLR